VLVGAAIVAAGSVFVLTSSAARHKDPNLAKAEAHVDRQCPADTRFVSKGLWEHGWKFNVLYGNCRAGDGRDQHAWFFDRGRFVGTDVPKGSSRHWTYGSKEINGVWRDGHTIALLYVLYRWSDPECCPTGGGAIVRYRLEKGHLRRLDPLPPRVSKGRIGR
jgi:hypothetical protein